MESKAQLGVLQEYEEDCVNGEAVIDSDEVKRAKGLEVEAVKAAEGDLERALSLLSEAIAVAPQYPSPYNNRAQVQCGTTL